MTLQTRRRMIKSNLWKYVTDATFDLQFDIVVVQNSFHQIKKVSFQAVEFLANLLQFLVK